MISIGQRAIAAVALCAAFGGAPAQTPTPLRFLHVSDTHLPRPASEQYLRELLDDAAARQFAFSIHTGDITEFGGRSDAWPRYLALFRATDPPHYDALGNHDQTWDALADRLRARHGAAYYRFETGGVVFLALNSATAQDPRPSYGEEQLRWLEQQLRELPRDARIALFQHHPPESDEFATPYETQRIYALLAGRDVLAWFVGHGHAARAGRAGAIPWVMGGSTFGGNQGHGECTIAGRAVHYVYDFVDPARDSVVLLDSADEPFVPFALQLDVTARDDALAVELRCDAGERPAPAFRAVRARVDFGAEPLARGAFGTPLVVPIGDLLPGTHVLTVETERSDGRVHHQLHEFDVAAAADARMQLVWRLRLPEAVQGPMAFAGDVVACCGNRGALRAIDLHTGELRWQRDLGGPAPGGVAVDGAGGFVAGTLDGSVARFAVDGTPSWRHELDAPIAAAPLAHGELVVCVDLAGNGHAFAPDGTPRWRRPLATYAIEKPPTLLDDRRAIVGAWDTRVHAFDLHDGAESWSLPARGARAAAARYFSPADCSPVVQDGKVFVADRKFELTVTDLEGHELSATMGDVASVAGDPGRHAVYLRRTTGAVTCLDSTTLAERWSCEVPVGRTPTPVTPGGADGAVVFAIGERDGVLYAIDAARGAIVARHRVNAGCYPFCPVVVRGDLAVVGGMDGRIAALRMRQ